MELNIGDEEVEAVIIYTAKSMYRKMPKTNEFELEWLIGSAWRGAMKAMGSEKFERGRAGWKNFIARRALGQIQDDIRNLSEVPRLMRERGQAPKKFRMGDVLVSGDGKTLDLEAVLHDESYEYQSDNSVWHALADIVGDDAVRMFRLYFEWDLTMKQIGECMDFSESRISQLFGLAIDVLRGERTKVAEIMGLEL